MRLIEFWLNNRLEFLEAILRHLALVVAAVGAAAAVGIPFGVLAYRKPKLGGPVIGFANIVQTIPSLAMFGFLIPIPLIGGIGARAALIVLFLYALLPIMRTTVGGMQSIEPSVREAGVAMGMTDWQLLRLVELPLAGPSIIAGLRVATVVGVGSATIAAAIGAGGLGEFIFRGVASVDSTVILAGAIPAALMALIADFSLGWMEKRAARQTFRRRSGLLRPIAILGASALILSAGMLLWPDRGGDRIVVGSKNFTEQVILGELLAQLIERETDLTVIRKLNLGDTLVCETAMRAGDLDLYVEYTGTALTAIFKQPVILDSDEVNRRVAASYAATGRTMLQPLGFNNTYVILMRGEDARSMGIETITQLARVAPTLRAGFGAAFLDREDGYQGLISAYGLHFAEPPRAMDLSLTYRALADKQVDCIAGDATNGLISKLDLVALKDDRHYFPPYMAVPIIRTEVLVRYPRLRAVLEELGGRISDEAMQRMNYQAEVERREPREIAGNFLALLAEQLPKAEK